MGTVYPISTDLQRHTATNKPWSEGISVTYTRRSESQQKRQCGRLVLHGSASRVGVPHTQPLPPSARLEPAFLSFVLSPFALSSLSLSVSTLSVAGTSLPPLTSLTALCCSAGAATAVASLG